MKKEEELQKLYVEFQMLNQQIKQLESQGTALSSQLMELTATNQSLEDMKKINKGAEILVPLSSGIYTKAEIKDNKNFIVNVGSGTAVVKDIDTTKKLIETQVNEIEKLQKNLINELQTQTAKAASLELEINKITSSIQGNK